MEEETVVANNPAAEPTISPSKPKRRKKSKKRRSTFGKDSDAEELKNRLLKRKEGKDTKRSRHGKLASECGPVVRRRTEKPIKNEQATTNDASSIYEVVNPPGYDKLFTRLEETNFNKVIKPDGVCLENSPWICCFCQRKPCVDGLGDLFGPYYVKLAPPTFWPPFIDRSGDEKSNKKSISASAGAAVGGDHVDLWFHGDCVHWAPGILLRGWGMTGLDEYLPKYWQQKCTRCLKIGASITCAVKGCERSFHYPCVVDSELVLKESTYSMYCDSHKNLAEKRK